MLRDSVSCNPVRPAPVCSLRSVCTQNERHSRKRKSTTAPGVILWSVVAASLLSGCTARYYRKAADQEVYRIIQQVERQVFGQTNAFSIDTQYSGRKPEEIAPSELIEDRLATSHRILRIDDALNVAVTHSRRYQAEKERLYLTALTLTGERYAFGPQFFAGSTATLDRESDGDRAGRVSSDAGFGWLFKTGGRLSVALANDILRYYTGDPRKEIVTVISANITQPLLRGFGRNNTAVESLTQAERNVIYAVRDFAFFQDDFSVEVVNSYFDLVAQKDVIRNRYTNYLSRVASTQRLEERAKDRESLVSVDQARQAELTARNNYVNAVANYRTALNQFKITLGLPVGENVRLEDEALNELERTGLIPVPLDADAAFRFAVLKQLQVVTAIDQFEDSKRKVRLAADRLKADLNLFADASLASEPPTDYTRFDPDNIRAGVGISLDLPIDRLPERNNYRATLVSFETELRNLTLTLDNLKENIERGLRTLRQRRQNYEIQKSALEVANRRVESTTLNMEAGRVEVRDLVEAQDAQINAQNALTAALVDYQEARLQLMLDIGAINTDEPRFWLRDHLAAANFENLIAVEQPAQDTQVVLPPDQLLEN